MAVRHGRLVVTHSRTKTNGVRLHVGQLPPDISRQLKVKFINMRANVFDRLSIVVLQCLLMDTGVAGHHGQLVVSHVVMAHTLEQEHARILLQSMVGRIVEETERMSGNV